MTRRRLVWLCTLLLLAVLGPPHRTAAQGPLPIVILVSIDGWRWDYLDRFKPAAIGRLAADGVLADGLVPIFPSKTFPNHYTIATGLYPQRHGIVSNTMVDELLPGRFSLGESSRWVQQDTRWWGGEPIWVTAERQGLIAGTMFWPGSDVLIAGDRPTFFAMYDHELPNRDRVEQVLVWLAQPPSAQPTFLTLYFSDVDTAGHDFGPDGAETRAAALAIDQAIAQLIAGIDRLGLSARTNIVLVSDHGMAALSPDRVIVVDDYVDMATVEMIDSAPILGLNPRTGTVEALYATLKDKHPALQVYLRENLPEHLNLRGHPRLPAVIGVADDGWHITTRDSLERSKGIIDKGNHGYEPRHRSMHGLFVATGPKFQRGIVVPAFENVHVYEMLCRVMGIRPAPNDGKVEATAGFLR